MLKELPLSEGHYGSHIKQTLRFIFSADHHRDQYLDIIVTELLLPFLDEELWTDMMMTLELRRKVGNMSEEIYCIVVNLLGELMPEDELECPF